MAVPGPDGGNEALRLLWKPHFGAFSAAHRREEDDLADGGAPGQDHHEPVDADTHTARGRHAVLERADEVLVEGLRLLIPLLGQDGLRLEAGSLLIRVVQLREGVRELDSQAERLPALHEAGL